MVPTAVVDLRARALAYIVHHVLHQQRFVLDRVPRPPWVPVAFLPPPRTVIHRRATHRHHGRRGSVDHVLESLDREVEGVVVVDRVGNDEVPLRRLFALVEVVARQRETVPRPVLMTARWVSDRHRPPVVVAGRLDSGDAVVDVVDVNRRVLKRQRTQMAVGRREVNRRLALVEGLGAELLVEVRRLAVEVLRFDFRELLDLRLQVGFKAWKGRKVVKTLQRTKQRES